MQFLADTTSSSGGNSWLTFLPLIVIGAALYFVMIRPQNKRRREAMEMQNSIAAGDEVQTVGGLYGTVTSIDDESVTLEAAPGVELRFARLAVGKVTKKADADQDDAGDASKVVDEHN